ncbi:MAG: chorismate lyase [gamma proteobacterium symbiont of Bathyaustriella thionipta]|nr:chorismate lyase [gamma proteobacterium symbiont of Bathyaustriella thionipta]MCU7951064.1 chorismate lyase [gamma proteobacterium symbiont of Bathyaustriella thionipta]MCU7954818.1 chorismate lyase [gamma proteobacterium symbiont of Bathyaustriella thionipta]MCU7957564.1 chorismate lyase [gamma proteobacterium symbiont of Bathyaustriella thionipta]MCU7968882.1 chorismate lyase [gamma proteobacterium symbiont of Bathyaustriella thionipta]
MRQFKRIPHWVAVDYAAILHIPDTTREWLLDSASLTLRIKNHCQANQMGNFSVKLLRQGMEIPSNDEVQRLKLNHRRYALIREVLLYCGTTPVIFARTVIPIKTLTGPQRQLSHLGNRPLGEFLFAQPALQRDAMEVAALKNGHQLHDIATNNLNKEIEQVWARRSIFRLRHKPLLVAEVFLPDLF